MCGEHDCTTERKRHGEEINKRITHKHRNVHKAEAEAPQPPALYIYLSRALLLHLLASAPPRLVALGTIQNKKY